MIKDSELTQENYALWNDTLTEFYTVYVCDFMEPEDTNKTCMETTYMRTMNRGLTV